MIQNVQGAVEEKYQGREFQSRVQAPTEEAIYEMLAQLSRFAKEQGLDAVRVEGIHPDPDGGYEATFSAHNWNPIKWVKGKFQKKEESRLVAGLLPTSEYTAEELDAQEELSRTERQSREWERRKGQTGESQQETQYTKTEEVPHEEQGLPKQPKDNPWTAWRKKKAEGRRMEFVEGWEVWGSQNIAGWEGMSDAMKREALEKATRHMPKERAESISKTYREAAQEAAEAGVPFQGYESVKVYQPGHWVERATGKKIPEPRTEAERRDAEYVPGHTLVQKVPVRRSPAQVMFEAQQARTGIEVLREMGEEIKGRRRARKLAPVRAIGSAAKEIVGVAILGTAGTAQAMQPGRGGPQRAARMLAPNVDPRLYEVARPPIPRPMRPQVDLSPLRESVIPRAKVRPPTGRKLRVF